jgi:hypothetical protein
MELQTTATKHTTITVRELFSMIEKGEYRVPLFQREFVWEPRRIIKLLDSILKGNPIGSLTLWDHSGPVMCRKIPSINEHSESSKYLIDGQQRATSLLYALKGIESGQNIYINSNVLEHYFDTGNINKEHSVFFKPPRHVNLENHFVLLSELMHDSYQRTMQLWCFKALGILKENILNYTIPVTEISCNEKTIVEIFERLNSSGKDLLLIDLMVARCYNHIDIRRCFSILDDILAPDFEGFLSFNTCEPLKLLIDVHTKDISKAEILALHPEDIEKKWIYIEEAYTLAAEFYKSIGIQNSSMVVNKFTFLVTAYFFYTNQGAPNHTQAENLKGLVFRLEKNKLHYTYNQFVRCCMQAVLDIIDGSYTELKAFRTINSLIGDEHAKFRK